MSVVRTFIGIALPDDVVDALVVACDAVNDVDPAWREEKWVPRQNLHVTLKFLGDIAEAEIDSLADAVARAASLHQPFELTGTDIRAVPNPRHTRMLWGTFVDPEDRCAALAAELDHACLEFGVRPEERAFKAHATLVRARRERRTSEETLAVAHESLTRAPECVSVPSVNLYSSRLTSREPIYTVLRECRLGAA